MTDETFAALEARLAPVTAAGSSREYRREVEALLAECRRLRRPPDVAGLMPAEEVEDLRKRLSVLSIPALDHIDAQAALIRELYGVVSDMHADDPGRQALLERGRAEGRGQAAALAEAASAGWVAALGTPHEPLREVAAKIRALGPCRPPPPPQESEREAERLREALRGLVAAAGKVRATLGPNTAAWFEGLAGAYDAARRALGEGAP